MMERQQNTMAGSADDFCSVLSHQLDEPMFGTAVYNEVWFLLEHDGPWGEKATTQNDLPPDVQAWLDEQVTAMMGRGRVQFIKQERERPGDTLTFYIAYARDMAPRMWRFALQNYRDLLEIDVPAVLADDGAYDEHLQMVPLYLVCSNGRRDRCCALFGLELYYNLQTIAGDKVWQTTHVGGHRFAANVLTFPDGTYYGRVHTGDIETFYETRERGELALEFLRGRSCYEKVVQAADYYLRRETEVHDLQAFSFDGLWSAQSDDFEVAFVATSDDQEYVVHLRREAVDLPIYASCGKPRVEPVEVYHLLSVEK